MQKIHIGKIIEREFKTSGISKKIFADKIKRSERHVTNIFTNESCDTQLLQIIGEVLHYDFFKHFKSKNEIEVAEDELELQLVIKIAKGTNKKVLLKKIEERLNEL